MKLFVITLLVIIAFMTSTGNSYADNLLLNEINGLIQLVSVQTERADTANGSSVSHKPQYQSDIRTIIQKAAKRYNLHPLLIESIIKVESGYNIHAVSNKGAMGLMQLMPATAREIGVTKPFDPYQNVIGGSYYYRLMLDRFGDHKKALAAYNCGPGCVENGYMPGETRKYVKNVIRVYNDLIRKGESNE